MHRAIQIAKQAPSFPPVRTLLERQLASGVGRDYNRFMYVPQVDMLQHPSLTLTMNTEVEKFSESKTTPLRIAMSSTGVNKHLCTYKKLSNHQYSLHWPRYNSSLQNFAIPGEDYSNESTGEDAMISAHCGVDNVVNHKYRLVDQTDFPKGIFLDEIFPAPVATLDGATTESVVMAVADGVGGLVNYEGNQTALMSHQLMRELRNNLTHDTYSARSLLQRAWDAFTYKKQYKIGACTAAVALIKPVKENVFKNPRYAELLSKRNCPFDDGQRLQLNYANVGDSTVLAFRPNFGSTGPDYVPLAMAWPLHHKYHTSNPPPMQLCVLDPQMKEVEWPTFTEYDHASLETSGSAASYFVKDGGLTLNHNDRIINIGADENGNYSLGIDPMNFQLESSSDQPWLCTEGTALLQRGDVVMVFSDGIGDNLELENMVSVVSFVQQAILPYVNEEHRSKFPFLRNIRPFAGNPDASPNTVLVNEFLENEAENIKADIDQVLTAEDEATVAGNYSALLSSAVLRFCQGGKKLDDLSIVVSVVY